MKTQSEIEKRLEKLRARYRRKYVQDNSGRHHQNCVHNYEHKPAGKFKYSKSHDVALSPRKQTTLLVLNEDQPVRICTYGSQGPQAGSWNGDVCDNDEKSSACPYFAASQTEEEAGAEFDELMKDVEYVFDNYRDVAALQWVLDVRGPGEAEPPPPSLLERIFAWFRPKPALLPPAPADDEAVTEPNPDLKGLWDADSQDPGP
jgi:hypothetical protein